MNNGDNSRRALRDGLRPSDFAQMTERLIREAGHPLTRGEIVKAFEARDVEIPAKDPARYLGTIAWRHKGMFKNVEGLGYWLKGEPMPSGSKLLGQFAEDPPEEHCDELPEK